MQHSVPYTIQKNGVAERKNISLKEMATCLLEARNIPSYMWDESMTCALYIQNIVHHKSVVGANPFEALMGNNPNVSHLRVFGSKAWDKIPYDKRKSSNPKVVNAFWWGM